MWNDKICYDQVPFNNKFLSYFSDEVSATSCSRSQEDYASIDIETERNHRLKNYVKSKKRLS